MKSYQNQKVMTGRESRKYNKLTILEKQFIVVQLIQEINNRYGMGMLDYAKNGICRGLK